MRLWSLQHPAVWEQVQREGVYRADGRRAIPEFRPAYAWLREQVRARVPGATGRALIWAWHSPKPDLRRAGHAAPGELAVRLEVEVPEDRVLLSDYDAWHFVLNPSYLPADLADADAHEARWEARLAQIVDEGRGSGLKPWQFAEKLKAELSDEYRASWDHIFDLDRMRALFQDPDYIGPDHEPQVQAVFEVLHRHEVKRIQFYRGR